MQACNVRNTDRQCCDIVETSLQREVVKQHEATPITRGAKARPQVIVQAGRCRLGGSKPHNKMVVGGKRAERYITPVKVCGIISGTDGEHAAKRMAHNEVPQGRVRWQTGKRRST